MSKVIKISNHLIGNEHPPFIVAEMSGNHNQSIDRALGIVEAAARAGAHAIKLQTYTANTLTIDVDDDFFHINDPNSLWHGQSLYKLYQQAYTPWEWHEPIFKRCHELGIIAFSTPFDETAIDFLESLNVPAYKIASFENNHLPMIRKAASTGKPLLISTGMATISELDEAVRTAREAGCKDIILLKCTSTYPATPEDSNLLTIPHLRQLFDVEVGLSDHTLGIGVAIASVALGATVIEKHFTLSRADGGVDSAFSMEPDEMKQLVEETHKAWQALGKVSYGSSEKEKASIRFRRSIYVVEDVKEGETFTNKNLRIIRPGEGLPPMYYDEIIGKKASRNVKRGTPMRWDLAGEIILNIESCTNNKKDVPMDKD
jgi:N-acetylneuraminate synthase